MPRTHRLTPSCLTILLATLPAAAGSLEPPGPPAPTMKTLSQIESIPIESLPGLAGTSHLITQPGSYYLTENLIGEPGKSGITIAASHVLVDLNGFAVIGSGSANTGISCQLGERSVTVRNGSITGWGGSGISVSCEDSTIEDIVAHDNAASGIRFDTSGATIRRCTARGNGAAGFHAVNYVTIRDSMALGNRTHGIHLAGTGSLVDGVTVYHEPDPIGIGVFVTGDSNTVRDTRVLIASSNTSGIDVQAGGVGTVLAGNAITALNGADGATAIRIAAAASLDRNTILLEGDGGRGVVLAGGTSKVERSFISGSGLNIIAILIGLSEGNGIAGNGITLAGSGGTGISIDGGSGYIKQNNVAVLGANGTGIIHSIAHMSGLMEDNFVMLQGAAGTGINVAGSAGDLILRNTVVGSGTAFSIGGGNADAEIVVDPTSGFSTGASANVAVGGGSR